MQDVYIAGAATTAFGKSPLGLVELMASAAENALARSGPHEVDALYVASMNPEEFVGESNIAAETAVALGLTGVPALRIETASSAGAAALHAAVHAIAAGCYRRVLVVAGEKMTHLTTGAVTRILAKVIDRAERQCGATMPALAAMITESYRKRYRLSRARLERMLCRVALKNHANGAHNPCAQFRRAISESDYLASKLVATPLRLYDCSPISDGAAAVLLTSEPTDIRIAGIGHATGPPGLVERDSLTSFSATRVAAARAYRMAGVSPSEIDFAEVHDAFTPFEIIATEDLGFFPPGKGGEAAEAGKTAIEGELPVNPSGGLKARGHPVGASGLAQVVEAVKRLRGESKPPGKRPARRALAHSMGGLGANNFVTIVELAELKPRTSALPPSPMVLRPRPRSAEAPPRPVTEGRIETFTVLYVTPDGYLPPLALALVRTERGRRLLAQGEDTSQLKIGREVYLRQVEGAYVFTVKGHLQKVREALNSLLRRTLAERRERVAR